MCGHPCGLHAVSHVRKDLSRCLAVPNFHERPSCHSWVAPRCPQAPAMIELHSVHQWDPVGRRPRPPGPQTGPPLHTCSASIRGCAGRCSLFLTLPTWQKKNQYCDVLVYEHMCYATANHRTNHMDPFPAACPGGISNTHRVADEYLCFASKVHKVKLAQYFGLCFDVNFLCGSPG